MPKPFPREFREDVIRVARNRELEAYGVMRSEYSPELRICVASAAAR